MAFDNVEASSINYDLKIDKSKHFYETITYVAENSNDKYFNNILNNDIYFDLNGTQKYTKTVTNSDNKMIIVLTYDYDYLTFNTSRIVNNCFDEVNYETTDNQIVFSTFGKFRCNFADDIKIKIISDMPVITNDADVVNNNEYEWDVNKGFLYIGVRLGEEDPNSGILPPHKETLVTGYDIGDTYTGIKERNTALVFELIGSSIVMLGLIYILLRKKKNKADNFNY